MIRCAPLNEPVYVDREMWEKIVLNLISNSFKFTFEGEIEVSLREAGTAVELTVRDTGTGIHTGGGNPATVRSLPPGEGSARALL